MGGRCWVETGGGLTLRIHNRDCAPILLSEVGSSFLESPDVHLSSKGKERNMLGEKKSDGGGGGWPGSSSPRERIVVIASDRMMLHRTRW